MINKLTLVEIESSDFKNIATVFLEYGKFDYSYVYELPELDYYLLLSTDKVKLYDKEVIGLAMTLTEMRMGESKSYTTLLGNEIVLIKELVYI